MTSRRRRRSSSSNTNLSPSSTTTTTNTTTTDIDNDDNNRPLKRQKQTTTTTTTTVVIVPSDDNNKEQKQQQEELQLLKTKQLSAFAILPPDTICQILAFFEPVSIYTVCAPEGRNRRIRKSPLNNNQTNEKNNNNNNISKFYVKFPNQKKPESKYPLHVKFWFGKFSHTTGAIHFLYRNIEIDFSSDYNYDSHRSNMTKVPFSFLDMLQEKVFILRNLRFLHLRCFRLSDVIAFLNKYYYNNHNYNNLSEIYLHVKQIESNNERNNHHFYLWNFNLFNHTNSQEKEYTSESPIESKHVFSEHHAQMIKEIRFSSDVGIHFLMSQCLSQFKNIKRLHYAYSHHNLEPLLREYDVFEYLRLLGEDDLNGESLKCILSSRTIRSLSLFKIEISNALRSLNLLLDDTTNSTTISNSNSGSVFNTSISRLELCPLDFNKIRYHFYTNLLKHLKNLRVLSCLIHFSEPFFKDLKNVPIRSLILKTNLFDDDSLSNKQQKSSSLSSSSSFNSTSSSNTHYDQYGSIENKIKCIAEMSQLESLEIVVKQTPLKILEHVHLLSHCKSLTSLHVITSVAHYKKCFEFFFSSDNNQKNSVIAVEQQEEQDGSGNNNNNNNSGATVGYSQVLPGVRIHVIRMAL